MEEPCNVEEDEADELASECQSQAHSTNRLDKTGNFNQLMNQIIQQYDQIEAEKEEDNFIDNLTLEISKIEEIK